MNSTQGVYKWRHFFLSVTAHYIRHPPDKPQQWNFASDQRHSLHCGNHSGKTCEVRIETIDDMISGPSEDFLIVRNYSVKSSAAGWLGFPADKPQ